MFNYRALSRPLGRRRLGGPILFKDLWPALREDLREAYAARAGFTRSEAGQLAGEPGTACAGYRSGADAFT